ncbi:hypothetical protein Taro_001208 [Colocasia esculenta]|uniref:HTH myb-type domain-containing protein n=1 Tax=Colocasia esculenta TaxID=4460 RepID=A0A843TCY7_COLES|nr:hypothetical protein [Colocasia esculenta]
MLAVSPLTTNDGERGGETVGGFSALGSSGGDNFSGEFSAGDLLEDIDFNDLFVGFDVDGDILPELELDPTEMLAEFSVGAAEDSGTTASADARSTGDQDQERADKIEKRDVEEEKGSSTNTDEAAPKVDDGPAASTAVSSSSSEADKGRNKPQGSQAKATQGKRKMKVDWTPELHRRFVQAVEQLGVDKAVPSRILELMGIDYLTRHNIASHLQKYRSHRKHLLAREAEAASWSQRRQMYGAPAGAAGAGGGNKRDPAVTPWLAPTVGFPPPAAQPFRPLHVWGHPTVDQSVVHMWPKHLVPSRSPPPPPWTPQPPPPVPDASYWHHPHYQRRFQLVPPVPGIPPHPMHRPDNTVPLPAKQTQSAPRIQAAIEPQPSKECIDSAIEDVLEKPWLPLPLGLKPPSLDSVLTELQRQGI